MWQLLAKIFGSSKVIDKAVDGIDVMFYTNEEKAAQKIKLLAAFEPFKLALRLLAMTISIPYVLMAMGAFVTSFWFDVTKQLDILDGKLGWAFTIVVAFYFADGIGIFKRRRDLRNKKEDGK